jgi:hypothetical protein
MKVIIGTGESILGTVSWERGAYRVEGVTVPTKYLADRILQIENSLQLEGLDLLDILPDYFEGTDKWARIEDNT